ncbi:UPF0489 family protein [Oscillospiraceae bacterium PP1C4]
MKTPCYIIEEHHEAYPVWMAAGEQGLICLRDNCLLHIDHHADMECGAYGCDFSDPNNASFLVREVLGIADFIVPAVYQEVFCEVALVLSTLATPLVWQDSMILRSDTNFLSVMDYIPFIHAPYKKGEKTDARYRYFRKAIGGIGAFSCQAPVVLDIDYDYFAWDDSLSTAPEKLIEITKEAYCQYTSNPHHPFRILPRRLLDGVERDGRYYLRYAERLKPEPLPSADTITKRISSVIEWLEKYDVQPQLITLCRSRFSGYTPAICWEKIEIELLDGLSKLYELQLKF